MGESLSEFYPVIEDINNEYVYLRRSGYGRSAAIAKLREDYAEELEDDDEGPAIRIALARALCKKHELTAQLRGDALRALEQLQSNAEIPLPTARLYKTLSRDDMLGAEAAYRPVKYYTPDWKLGDTFSHKMSSPLAEKLGIGGWYILFRKAGEYTDNRHRTVQLMYTTLCPPDALPKSSQELDSLGFLIMARHDHNTNEYLSQLSLSRRKDEALFELTRIGSYPDAKSPPNEYPADVRALLPIFHFKDSDSIPSYETDICLTYKEYGIYK